MKFLVFLLLPIFIYSVDSKNILRGDHDDDDDDGSGLDNNVNNNNIEEQCDDWNSRSKRLNEADKACGNGSRCVPQGICNSTSACDTGITLRCKPSPPSCRGEFVKCCPEDEILCSKPTTTEPPIMAESLATESQEELGSCVETNKNESNKTRCNYTEESEPYGECYAPQFASESKPSCNRKNMLAPATCGYRNIKGLDQQHHQEDSAEYAEFPWMMAVMKKPEAGRKGKLEVRGGGSLIHHKIVLTAAHKVPLTADRYVVRGGEWNLKSNDEPCDHVDIDVAEIIVHENYNDNYNYANNIALLVLKKRFELTATINIACLPTEDVVFDNQRCHALGWGVDKFGPDGVSQNVLKKVELPVVSSEECQDKLRMIPNLGGSYKLQKSYMCAGGEPGKDTCIGDGGSPLSCAIEGHPNHYFLAGLVVGGVGCGKAYPALYSNIQHHLGWIHEQMRLQELTVPKFDESLSNDREGCSDLLKPVDLRGR